MRRLLTVVAIIVAVAMAVAPPASAKDKDLPSLGCYGCHISYGDRGTWVTGCWSNGNNPPRLEAKVDGRWKVYDSKARPIKNMIAFGKEVCPKSAYPYVMAYSFTVEDEGTIMQGGPEAGNGLLLFREVWQEGGKTQTHYLKAYVLL